MAAIELEPLRDALAAADSAAVLVPARTLRKVVKAARGVRFLGGAAARQTFFVAPGKAVGAVVRPEEVGRRAGEPWPATVLLVAEPEPRELAGMAPEAALLQAWRRLFRARIAADVRRAVDSEALRPEVLRSRVEAIGGVEFDEVRAVLRQDGLLTDPHDDADAYAAFAATFLDQTRFAPQSRGYTFPAIEFPEPVAALLGRDVDVESLWQATRPAKAPDPCPPPPETDEDDEAVASSDDLPETPEHPAPSLDHSAQSRRSLAARAKAAGELGNHVRAAVLWTAGARKGMGREEGGEVERASARSALKHLADRLQKALFVRKGEAELWADALAPLLPHAARGFWSPEARLLYDLQKVCIDHEREVYRIEVIPWATSLGKIPLKRALPHLREVTMSNHLRGASKRLPKVHLTRERRLRLEGLIRPALHRAEEALRDRFRPCIDRALKDHWVAPTVAAERVAYRKLVDELLDRIVGRGFTTLGDFRDAASRSNLKLPDLSGPREFFLGDKLLDSDKALARSLEGVHRRGEIYMRWLQRGSALAFGTPAGRWISRFLILPYGGAYVVLKGVEEIAGLFLGLLTFLHLRAAHHLATAPHHPEASWHPEHPWVILALGTLALGVINYPKVRRRCFQAASTLGRSLRAILVDLPSWLLANPWLRAVARSAPARFLLNFGVKPALVALPLWVLLLRLGAPPTVANELGVLTFLVSEFVFNTRTGREIEEDVAESALRASRAFVFDLIPGLFRLVMSEFERLLEWVEKLIYAVDEWLRFRDGQGRVTLFGKAALGLAWGVVAYLVRFYVNLLIEPQVNPIKHFPVVTVSHKVILPMSLKITPVIGKALTPFLGRDLGLFVAGVNVLLLPGVFGFLVWELKSNWRLYEANRPEALGPVVVGSHGETLVGLLRPGFHSGTIPKNFARLRRARRDGREHAALKRRETLHHAEESLRRFVNRDLVAVLHESRALGDARIEVGAIRLATRRVRIELLAADHPGSDHTARHPQKINHGRESLWLEFLQEGRTLDASVTVAGWSGSLSPRSRHVLEDALIGFLKMSAVDRVSQGLNAPTDLAHVVLTWRAWVETWEADRAGIEPAPLAPARRA